MPNYSEGKIYKIINDINEKVYIGSTSLPVSTRMTCHRGAAKRECTSPMYTEMRRIGVEHFKIILIENFPCKSKIELEKREFHIIRRFLRQDVKLLNSTIEFGKYSTDTKKKMSGSSHPGFKRGYLIRRVIGKYTNWVFNWYEEGKQRSKSFSVQKYGEKRAKRLAEKKQNKVYPL